MKNIFYILFLVVFLNSLFGKQFVIDEVYYKRNESSDWQATSVDFLMKNRITDLCYYRLVINFDEIKDIDDPALLLGRVEGSINVKLNNVDIYSNSIDTRNNYFRLNNNLQIGSNNLDIIVSIINKSNSGRFSIIPIINNYTSIDNSYRNRTIVEIALALFILLNGITIFLNFSIKIKNYENIFFTLISFVSFIFMVLRSQFQFYLFDTLHIDFFIIRKFVSISLFIIPYLSVCFFSIVFIKKNKYNFLITNIYLT